LFIKALGKKKREHVLVYYCAWRLPAWAQRASDPFDRHYWPETTLRHGFGLGGLPSNPNLRPAGSSHRARPSIVTIHRLTGNQYYHNTTHARRPRHARAPAAKGIFHICTASYTYGYGLTGGWPAPDAYCIPLSSFFKKGGGERWTVTLCFHILPPSQIISDFKDLTESKHFKFDQIYMIR
jgi:hypothetical protein